MIRWYRGDTLAAILVAIGVIAILYGSAVAHEWIAKRGLIARGECVCK